jgi:hypothetical protein
MRQIVDFARKSALVLEKDVSTEKRQRTKVDVA